MTITDPRMLAWIEALALVMMRNPEEFEVIKADFGRASSTLTIQTYLPDQVLPK